MPSPLTAGFDFTAQLSQLFAEKVFRAAYDTGRIPNLVSRSFSFGGVTVTGDLYLSRPSMRFVRHPSFVSAARVDIPLLLRLSTLDDEVSGTASVVVPIAFESSTDGAGAPGRMLVADFRGLADTDVSIPGLGSSPPAQAAGPLLQEAVATLLRTQVLRVPVSPSIAGLTPFVTGRIFCDPDFKPPATTHYPEPDYIAIFLNLDGQQMPLPDQFPPQLAHMVEVAHELQRGYDSMLAIPADFVLQSIRDGLARAGLGSLPAALPGDSSVTIEALNFELRPGHLHVSGRASKSVDLVPDPTADISADLTVGIFNGQVQITTHNVKIGLPAWADALHFLLPFLGTVILSVVQRAIESLSGQTIGIPLPALSFFAGDIQVSTVPSAARPAVIVDNTGNLFMRPDGVQLGSTIDLQIATVPIARPIYIRAHIVSLEFHRVGCEFGDKIKASNLRRFVRETAALAAGFNGCATCCPEFNDS